MPSGSSAKGGSRYIAIGKYRVIRHIATGGMGAVYRAVDTETGREAALKILPPELAVKPGVLERFRREAELGSKLRHENLVSIYEMGEAAGTHYLALEFVDGHDLWEYVRDFGPLDPEESRQVVRQVALALEYANQHNIIHRDIKPSNLLLSRRESGLLVKLTDLGLARVTSDDDFRLTRAGATVGTVDYMAPEQARDSSAADIRSDLYSLGCTWFHMLTGEPPYVGGTVTERMYQHCEAPVPDVRERNSKVSDDLARILSRMLAKKPEDRHQTPAELILDLDGKLPAAAAPAPPPAERPRRKKRKRKRTRPAPEEAAPTPSRQSEALVEPPVTPLRQRPATPDSAVPALASEDQRRVAAGQAERAAEVIADGNYDYGIELLLSCCKLDPGNLYFRQLLRRTEKAKYGNNQRGSRFAWLASGVNRARLKSAQGRGEHLKVLEHGEQVLTQNPWDTAAQMAMTESAEALGLLPTAVWLLEEAREKDAEDRQVTRSLARLYELQGDLTRAIEMWDVLSNLDPMDGEARQKCKDLAARETIERGQYGMEVGRRKGRRAP
jgi:serine/threonine protein kinase